MGDEGGSNGRIRGLRKGEQSRARQMDELDSADRVEVAKGLSGASLDRWVEGETLEERLKRVVCVRDVPWEVSEEELVAEFGRFGAMECICFEFQPLRIVRNYEDAKDLGTFATNYRRNAYVVYMEEQTKVTICEHLKEFGDGHPLEGKVLAIDSKCEDIVGETAFAHTLCIGNLPFDVEAFEILKLFNQSAKQEQEGEALRYLRDFKTSAGNGFAFILFNSKAASKRALRQGPLRLRGRILKVQYIYKPNSTAGSLNHCLWSMHLRSDPEVNSSEENRKLIPSDLSVNDHGHNGMSMDLDVSCDENMDNAVVLACPSENEKAWLVTDDESGHKDRKAVSQKSKKKNPWNKMSKCRRRAMDKAKTLTSHKLRNQSKLFDCI